MKYQFIVIGSNNVFLTYLNHLEVIQPVSDIIVQIFLIPIPDIVNIIEFRI